MDNNAPTAAHFQRYNPAPLVEFAGLNPNQMHALFYDPLGPGSPVQLPAQLADEVLDQVPFLRLTEGFLRMVGRETSIKLTATGALPRKHVHELYDLGFFREETIDSGQLKLLQEAESAEISTMHINSTLAGFVKKVNGKLTLTKKGEQLRQPAQRPALLRQMLLTFTGKFNWGYNDHISYFEGSPVGQIAWAYSIYLLAKFGATARPVPFYAGKYAQALPFMLHSFKEQLYFTKQQQFESCYEQRVFSRFMDWLGLVQLSERTYGLDAAPTMVSATDLLLQLFRVNLGA